jgi:hypothetical protein
MTERRHSHSTEIDSHSTDINSNSTKYDPKDVFEDLKTFATTNNNAYQTFHMNTEKTFFDDLPEYIKNLDKKTLHQIELFSIKHLSEAFSIQNSKQIWKFLKQMIKQCPLISVENKPAIAPAYAIQSALKSVVMQHDVDACIAIHSDFRNGRTIEEKMTYIRGFIIVELGECKRVKDHYTINLICAPHQELKGSVLIGAYLYLAKLRGQSLGILEVASKYTNIAAVCAYDKFGFQENLLFYENCFPDEEKENLPMTVDLSKLEYHEILYIASTNKRLSKLQTPNSKKLCRYIPDPNSKLQIDIQQKLGELHNDRVLLMSTSTRNVAHINRIVQKIHILQNIIISLKRGIDPLHLFAHYLHTLGKNASWKEKLWVQRMVNEFRKEREEKENQKRHSSGYIMYNDVLFPKKSSKRIKTQTLSMSRKNKKTKKQTSFSNNSSRKYRNNSQINSI